MNMKLRNILLLLFFFLTSCTPNTFPPPISKHEVYDIQAGNKEIWSITDFYIGQDSFSTRMGAAQGRFCFLGNKTNVMESKVSCLDSTNGKLLWSAFSGNSSTFTITDNGVFLGYSGIPGIAKYSLDGDFLWEQTLNGTGVVYIYEIDDQVQVLSVPEKLSIFDTSTGKLINKIKGEKIFITTPTEQFINLFGLTLLSPATGKTLWETDLDDYLELAPIFSKKLIFVRTGQVIGSVYAIDRASGKILWETDDNIISNIAYSPGEEVVYVLSDKGELLRIDSAGAAITLLRFSKTPFFLNGDAQVGGYEVAYDEKTNSLFITLGDSRQLFAFHVQ